MSRPDAIVVGGGIAGLSTAVRLAESGRETRVWTAARWPDTVSSIAAAIWYPFRAYPLERVSAWARRSFEVFVEDARHPDSGVRMREGRVFWGSGDDGAEVRNVPSEIHAIPETSVPPPYSDGIVTTVPVVEMPLYLPWLEGRLERLGVRVETRAAAALDEALSAAPLVANCAGLGAGPLAGDDSMTPIRGQVLRVENPGIDRFTLDAGDHAVDITYVIPRSRDVVLGGTATAGSTDLRPDQTVAREILERCSALEPSLRNARVLGHAVGLRPGRPSVRVEREDRPAGKVIHNYGHGGSGVTVCWGCAEAVIDLSDGP